MYLILYTLSELELTLILAPSLVFKAPNGALKYSFQELNDIVLHDG